jgi:formate hydrogenlyase subunit 6/NADH:ubiquinone oxidoreductase subunit I
VPVCPVDAVFQNNQGDVFVCIHCGRCVDYCPQNCLAMRDVTEIQEVLL